MDPELDPTKIDPCYANILKTRYTSVTSREENRTFFEELSRIIYDTITLTRRRRVVDVPQEDFALICPSVLHS
jgi:hypothetical protein